MDINQITIFLHEGSGSFLQRDLEAMKMLRKPAQTEKF
jgi:hypothetical protein